MYVATNLSIIEVTESPKKNPYQQDKSSSSQLCDERRLYAEK